MMASMQPYITDSLKNVDAATGRFNDLMTSLDEGDGVIGSLLKDPEMKDEVKQSVADLHATIREVKDVVGKMKKFQVYWDYDFFYMPQAGLGSSDLALDVYTPSGYTFYRAGLSNMGNEDDALPAKDYLEKNKIDVRLGLYNEWGKFSAGLIRGAGGVALEVKPFYKSDFWSRIAVGGEFTDFGRDRMINGRRFNKPNISYGVDFSLNRFFKVGAWQRDALETNNFALKANVTFNDQDISSFFGLAAVAGSSK
jgi:phospholipid/cholesterol/gamma-HCH transport system substrate-binding protein